eukprot:CAMPEP_0197914326 /NCGR_PEP_ID=MMETSP1439-20131203/78329_1 /TAXON_ID=66791 /ORGANISM="Gonyaulax spinifera, Strain CCMP409" /LENGTH=52 /DNA_ID=CAMNT_0043536235 /DNA_START=23 /DNA_END=177 /DNA_ORIENTATION=-
MRRQREGLAEHGLTLLTFSPVIRVPAAFWVTTAPCPAEAVPGRSAERLVRCG